MITEKVENFSKVKRVIQFYYHIVADILKSPLSSIYFGLLIKSYDCNISSV